MGASPDIHVRRPSRIRLVWIALAATAAVLLLAAPFATTSRASEVATWEGRLVRDLNRLEQLVEQRAETVRELADIRARRAASWDRVSQRLSSLYKSGGSPPVEAAIVAGNSVTEAADTANAIAAVADHDEQALRRYERLGAGEQSLEDKLSRLDARIEAAKDRVVADRAKLVKARAAARKAKARAVALARKAKARAAALARTAQSPLVPREVSVHSVAAVLAGEDPQQDSAPSGYAQTGVASMYADSFTGEETANGETYQPGAMTAAHPTLPLGTWVLVQGPGGSAMVRINDRGPFVGGRIIDLSRAAANAVGLGGLGTVSVRVQ